VPEERGTRERLIAVAAELVDEGGPAAVTLREVGARAGVSHNTPYRHFADMRDLLAVVAAGALRDLRRGSSSSSARGPEPHDELGAAAGAATEAMRACVTAAVEDGSLVEEPERVSVMVWALGHGAVDLALSGQLTKRPTSPTVDELVRELITRLSA
jgi:AcrR family transcriptional regulator